MKKVTLFCLLLSGSLLFTGCKKDENNTEPIQETTEASMDETVVENQITTTPATPEATSNQGEKPTLNPPHGQPYHRCDIAVGAPLDSPAGNNPNAGHANTPANAQTDGRSFFKSVQSENPNSGQQQISTPTPAPQQAYSANNTGPKPATNPEHGKPWHRCDIAVGAPLP